MCAKDITTTNVRRDGVRQVETLVTKQGESVHQTWVQLAKKRGDDWGDKVLLRLQSCLDLVASEAKYHNFCLTSFKQRQSECTKRGRPAQMDKSEAFDNFCRWFEDNCTSNCYSIQELYLEMAKVDQNSIYTLKTFREKLLEKYKDDAYVIPRQGRTFEMICLIQLFLPKINERILLYYYETSG